ncbi:hypothetical protein A3N68_10255 [Enterobacter asburiae]|nr:hypothetical protein A3N68_10255 [Enterobacter asburiae]
MVKLIVFNIIFENMKRMVILNISCLTFNLILINIVAPLFRLLDAIIVVLLKQCAYAVFST